jgi:hypothetical protein
MATTNNKCATSLDKILLIHARYCSNNRFVPERLGRAGCPVLVGRNGVAGSPWRNEAPAGLGVGMHGTMTGTGTPVVSNEVKSCGGEGDDD